MTVTYTAEVATCRKFGCFINLLGRWRGSIYKLIWLDLILFLLLYYCINLIYVHLLKDESKRTFESVVYYCASYTSLIPLSFVLGFYVNLVMTRWWEQYITIPWPDSIAVFVSAHVHGQDESSRLMRRTVMRYVCLCLTIVFTMISPCVKKRFPKMRYLVEAGLLLENEQEIIESMDSSFPKYPKHWMPIVWAASIITRARKEGRIRDDFAVKTIIDELNSFRGLCGTLMYYDFISIPLVYTQVVTIAVYSFFLCSLLAHQWTDSKKDTYEALDFYSPVFITLQFFFYMGWLKVAETLINPFGEDDDDFEVNWMIDRNLQVSYLIVDEMHHEHPELVKDQYWDEVYPNELPYENEIKREQPPEPSTAKYDLEDAPKRALSNIISPTNSVEMHGKFRTSIQSSLNRRSQRFNEAFQRFFANTEEDSTSTRADVENSFENVEHITSYAHSDLDEFESQLENENLWTRSALEQVAEEGEELSETLEEEVMPDIEEEEEDDKIETHSSCESDSDTDLFEKLCNERQQERLQRMNNYLERHFGPNFRIVTENLATPRTKSQSYKPTSLQQNKGDERTLDEPENEEDHLTQTISNNSTKLDASTYQYESGENLLTPKISNAFFTPDTSAEAIEMSTNVENMTHEKSLIHLENSETKFSETKIIMEIVENAASNIKIQASISLTPADPITQDEPSSSRIVAQTSISPLQVQAGKLLATSENLLSEPSKVSTIIEQTSLYSPESDLFWKSKATSPLGSARSVSTQSSLVDDWELLSTGRTSVTGEYRVDVEESDNDHSDGTDK